MVHLNGFNLEQKKHRFKAIKINDLWIPTRYVNTHFFNKQTDFKQQNSRRKKYKSFWLTVNHTVWLKPIDTVFFFFHRIFSFSLNICFGLSIRKRLSFVDRNHLATRMLFITLFHQIDGGHEIQKNKTKKNALQASKYKYHSQ